MNTENQNITTEQPRMVRTATIVAFLLSIQVLLYAHTMRSNLDLEQANRANAAFGSACFSALVGLVWMIVSLVEALDSKDPLDANLTVVNKTCLRFFAAWMLGVALMYIGEHI